MSDPLLQRLGERIEDQSLTHFVGDPTTALVVEPVPQPPASRYDIHGQRLSGTPESDAINGVRMALTTGLLGQCVLPFCMGHLLLFGVVSGTGLPLVPRTALLVVVAVIWSAAFLPGLPGNRLAAWLHEKTFRFAVGELIGTRPQAIVARLDEQPGDGVAVRAIVRIIERADIAQADPGVIYDIGVLEVDDGVLRLEGIKHRYRLPRGCLALIERERAADWTIAPPHGGPALKLVAATGREAEPYRMLRLAPIATRWRQTGREARRTRIDALAETIREAIGECG